MYSSNNYGTTFTSVSSFYTIVTIVYRDNNLNDNYKTAFCYSSAISANGQYSYMLQYISTSSDFGVQGNNNNYGSGNNACSLLYIKNNFTNNASYTQFFNYLFNAIAVSATGQYVTVTQALGSSVPGSGFTGGDSGFLYVSNNYGSTFNKITTYQANYNKVAISSSGQYQAVTINIGKIYISSDFGNTWIASNSKSAAWSGITMSSDGKFLAACISNGNIYFSNNWGMDWYISNAPSGYWNCITMSSNGRYITACKSNYSSTSDYIFNSITPFSNMSISDILNVYNDTSLNNRLFVGGDVSLNANFAVNKDSGFNKRLFIGSNTYINTAIPNISTNSFYQDSLLSIVCPAVNSSVPTTNIQFFFF